jgi:hypothetical protein
MYLIDEQNDLAIRCQPLLVPLLSNTLYKLALYTWQPANQAGPVSSA